MAIEGNVAHRNTEHPHIESGAAVLSGNVTLQRIPLEKVSLIKISPFKVYISITLQCRAAHDF